VVPPVDPDTPPPLLVAQLDRSIAKGKGSNHLSSSLIMKVFTACQSKTTILAKIKYIIFFI
jgi:hypothetical protein